MPPKPEDRFVVQPGDVVIPQPGDPPPRVPTIEELSAQSAAAAGDAASRFVETGKDLEINGS
jgi:hypothetical protein